MKKGILFVLTAAFLASCQQEENEGVASVDRVTITPIITRATEVNFEDQDQIGLSVTKEDGTVYATNELTILTAQPVYRLHSPCMPTRPPTTESPTLWRQANPTYFLR